MTKNPRLLFLGAHDVDFLVRAGGTLAKYAQRDCSVTAVSLTYGERQESERLWAERPNLTLEEVKRVREEEGRRCAEAVGAELRFLDWGDCPIVFDQDRLLQMAGLIREVRPDILITHWPQERTNWDHADTAEATLRAAQYAGAAGALRELEPWRVPTIYFSEPTFPFPDLNEFSPNVYVDITDTYEVKVRGLETAWSHGKLEKAYRLCAEYRGYQASRLLNDPSIRYAEAFVRYTPFVGSELI